MNVYTFPYPIKIHVAANTPERAAEIVKKKLLGPSFELEAKDMTLVPPHKDNIVMFLDEWKDKE